MRYDTPAHSSFDESYIMLQSHAICSIKLGVARVKTIIDNVGTISPGELADRNTTNYHKGTFTSMCSSTPFRATQLRKACRIVVNIRDTLYTVVYVNCFCTNT